MMGILLVAMIMLMAVGIVGFGVAALVDTQRRKQEQHDFLTGAIRQAVYHTASLPVGPQHRRGLLVQPLPLLVQTTRQFLEDSGVYPVV